MRSVRLFDFIEFDGSSWQVVAQEGTTIAIKSLATNRIRRVPLLDLLGDDSFLPDSPDRLPKLDDAAVLDTVDDSTRQRALFLHHHIVEVLTGVPPNDGLRDHTSTRIRHAEPVGRPYQRQARRTERRGYTGGRPYISTASVGLPQPRNGGIGRQTQNPGTTADRASRPAGSRPGRKRTRQPSRHQHRRS